MASFRVQGKGTEVEAIALNASKASKALSLTKGQFLELVEEGTLPRPVKLGPYSLWDTEELQAIFRGDKVDGFEGIKW